MNTIPVQLDTRGPIPPFLIKKENFQQEMINFSFSSRQNNWFFAFFASFLRLSMQFYCIQNFNFPIFFRFFPNIVLDDPFKAPKLVKNN